MDRPIFPRFMEHYAAGPELDDGEKASTEWRSVPNADPKMRGNEFTKTNADGSGVDFRLSDAGRDLYCLSFSWKDSETSNRRFPGQEFITEGVPLIGVGWTLRSCSDFQMREYVQSGRFAKIFQFETEVGSSPDLFLVMGFENKAVPFEGGNSDPRPLIGKRVFPIDFVGFKDRKSVV